MAILTEDERIKGRIHYFGYQAFWITFWLLIAGGLIIFGFRDKIIIRWFFMPSIAIVGLLFYVFRSIWEGIDLLKFQSSGIHSSFKKLLLFSIVFLIYYGSKSLLFEPEYTTNHPFRAYFVPALCGLIPAGFFYLGRKFIDWRNKKALGSEETDPEQHNE